MEIYNGTQRAQEIESRLMQQVTALQEQGVSITIAAILFEEDSGSRLYTQLKGEAAARVGIEYQVHTFSLTDAVEAIQQKIHELNENSAITGIIIQKPWRKTWGMYQPEGQSSPKKYADWWTRLVSVLSLEKDVDGLHPQTLQAIKEGTWQEQGRVLPATAQAVLTILQDYVTETSKPLTAYNISIIGTSDLLGRPLFFELQSRGVECKLLGRKELSAKMASGEALKKSDIIVSATGVKGLITADMIGQGTALIDVGEPRADVDFDSVFSSGKPAFITPVPGGVGPLTIVCLLQNAVSLANRA